MKAGRFFVTYVIVLGIFVLAALNAPQMVQERSVGSPDLVQEGNLKIQESQKLSQELQTTFGIDLTKKVARFDWGQFSQVKRFEAQAKIAHYLEVINRVMEIGAQRLIMIENRDQLVLTRDNAEVYQRSAENFVEKTPRNVSENEG